MSKFNFRGEELGELWEKHAKVIMQKCVACNQSDYEKWNLSGPFTTLKCKTCDLVFMSPYLDDEGLSNYYQDYIGKRRLNNLKKLEQRDIQYQLDAKVINRIIKTGKLLDVGCNGGFFLNALGEGFERYGTELDPAAIAYAKDKYPEFASNLRQGTLEAAEFENETFDLVTMRGVIEHVPDPDKSIREVARILQPGGYYFVCATPNGESLCAEVYRENWTLFHPAQHIWHFSPKNLELICETYDLKMVWQEFPYLGTPYESVQEDIVKIADTINKRKASGNDNPPTADISPPFFQNMMSLVFQKIV